MKQTLRDRLERLAMRLEELDSLLSSPETGANPDALRRLSQERAEVEPVATLFARFCAAEADIAEARAMLADPEMAEMAAEEIAEREAALPEIEFELQKLLLPKDANDERNVFLEIARQDAFDRVYVALDFFDASINRKIAYIVGTRATRQAILYGLLDPSARLQSEESAGELGPKLALMEAMRTMRENSIGCLPVVQGGELIGMITEMNFLRVSGRLIERLNKE